LPFLTIDQLFLVKAILKRCKLLLDSCNFNYLSLDHHCAQDIFQSYQPTHLELIKPIFCFPLYFAYVHSTYTIGSIKVKVEQGCLKELPMLAQSDQWYRNNFYFIHVFCRFYF